MAVHLPAGPSPVDLSAALAAMQRGLSVQSSEEYEARRRGLCLSPRQDELPRATSAADSPRNDPAPVILRNARRIQGPLVQGSVVDRLFELHRWFDPHLPRRPIQSVAPTKGAFIKRFVSTTIITTILAKAFFAGFNPWVTAIVVLAHTLQSRIVYELFHAYADPASRLRATRDAQNYALENLLHVITLVALGTITCLSLNLRLTTFATYYLFTLVSERLTFGILNVIAYCYPAENEAAELQPVAGIEAAAIRARRAP